MSTYSFFYVISNDFIIMFSIKILKIIQFILNFLSLLLTLSLITSLILITAFLLLEVDIPYEQFKIFFILSIFAITPPIILFLFRIYYAKIKFYKTIVNPNLIYSFLLIKLDFYFFNKNYKKQGNNPINKSNNSSSNNNAEIIVGELLDFPNSNMQKLYRIYQSTVFSKLDVLLKNWFVVIIIFLWSSFISLFAIIID